MKHVLARALSGILFDGKNVPVSQFEGMFEVKTYITYQLLSEQSELSADDEEQETTIHFSVDLYTRNADFDELVKAIRKRLKGAGFAITNRGPEIYEEKDKLYHIVTDCSIENLEED